MEVISFGLNLNFLVGLTSGRYHWIHQGRFIQNSYISPEVAFGPKILNVSSSLPPFYNQDDKTN